MDIHFICGVPASGKDWYAFNAICGIGTILSFDKIRMDIYGEHCRKYKIPFEENTPKFYDDAWNFCNSSKVNLGHHLAHKIDELALFNESTFFICNTMCTVKSRARMIHDLDYVIKKYNPSLYAHFLLVSSATAKKRNKERKDHVLSDEVMNKFLNGPQEFPSIGEGFKEVFIVYNE